MIRESRREYATEEPKISTRRAFAGAALGGPGGKAETPAPGALSRAATRKCALRASESASSQVGRACRRPPRRSAGASRATGRSAAHIAKPCPGRYSVCERRRPASCRMPCVAVQTRIPHSDGPIAFSDPVARGPSKWAGRQRAAHHNIERDSNARPCSIACAQTFHRRSSGIRSGCVAVILS